MLNAFGDLLCLLLCWHNRLLPSEIYQMTNRCLLVITKSLGTVYNISFLQYFTKFEWQYNYVDMYHQLSI